VMNITHSDHQTEVVVRVILQVLAETDATKI